jgi:hypothetical protein
MRQGGVGVRLRIVLSFVLFFSLSYDIGAIQVPLSEGTIALESEINEKGLAF